MNKQDLIKQYRKRIRLLYKDIRFIAEEINLDIPSYIKDYEASKLEISILQQVIKDLKDLNKF